MKRHWMRTICLLAASLASAACGGGGGKGHAADSSPGPVVLTGATARTTSIEVAWTNPSAPDLDHVTVTWSLEGTTVGTASVTDGSAAYSITSLATSREYSIILTAVDAAGHESTPAVFDLLTTASGAASYSFIYTVEALDAVHGGLSGNYVLMGDLDLAVAPFDTGTGWPPIGNSTTPYMGIFIGNHHMIRNLHIEAGPGASATGLFGSIDGAAIRHLGLASMDVTGGSGGLVGHAVRSTIADCSVGGTIEGANSVGGLIGDASSSTVVGCSSTATVVATSFAGGLVGSAVNSTLSGCTTAVTVVGAAHTGGLAGYVAGSTLQDCTTAGIVTGSGASTGGLAGYANTSTVTRCHAAATVAASGDNDGGLIGYSSGSTVTRCSATGAVTGGQYVGGLVGYAEQGAMGESFASGGVVGTYYVGGFVGYDSYTPVTNCYARGSAAGNTFVGGFAGLYKCESSACSMNNAYSTGAPSYQGDSGDNGGFMGYQWYFGWVGRCYFDIDTSGQSSAQPGVEPLHTAAMKLSSNFDTWDFWTIWSADAAGAINDGYMYLTNNAP